MAKGLKVIAAERRLKKEGSFLDQLAVRHDDPDAVLNDDGKTLSFQKLVDVAGVSFSLGNVEVAIDVVKSSLKVVAGCRATIKRLGGGQ